MRPRAASRRAQLAGAVLAGIGVTTVLSSGCRGRTTGAAGASPEAVTDAFLDAIESAPVDADAPARAYALLSSRAREVLAARARRASAVRGTTVSPESMLIVAYTPLRWSIEDTKTTIAGDGSASVELFGLDRQSQHASVHLVRESNGYRIDLDLEPRPMAATSPIDGGR